MAKGARTEREAVEIYESAGFDVYRPETARYGDNDMWNLFDLAGIDSRRLHDTTRTISFAQVKSNRARGITDWFSDAYPFTEVPGVEIHYLVRHDGHGGSDPTPAAWRLAVPVEGDADAYRWAVDERGEVDGTGELLEEYLRRIGL